MAAALAEADVFALPCIDEDGDMDGCPVIGEAMAAGVPVVTTDVSAIPEVVEDGRTGFVAVPGDHVGLAERIRQALGLAPAPRRRLIIDAQRRAGEVWESTRPSRR